MNTKNLPPVVVIAGPTASGKSALAMALADLTPSVIINADSMQVYRDLRIVTARPSIADEERHPHRLFGTIDGAEACSAARWAAEAKSVIAAAQAQAQLPILVGGTGLYIRTLLDGIAPVPTIDPAVRAGVRAMTVANAYAALQREDVASAVRLAPADMARVIGGQIGLEVTGRVHVYETEPRDPPGENPRGYGIKFTPFNEPVAQYEHDDRLMQRRQTHARRDPFEGSRE